MTIRKMAALILVLLQTNLLFAQEVVNDPNVEVRAVGENFTSIRISGTIELFLSQGTAEAVAVSAANEKHRAYIKTEVKDHVLSISYQEGPGVHFSVGNRSLKAYVSFTTLEKLKISGASKVQVAETLNVPSLLLELSGASVMSGRAICNNLSVELSGASDLKISGAVNDIRIDAGGASRVWAYDLISDNCSIKASGASTVNVTVNKELNARATGASDINYKGTAIIKAIDSSGAGSIRKKD